MGKFKQFQKIFYVYEHWRPDTNQPFYVGKGLGKRGHLTKPDCHNLYYDRIVAKLTRKGMRVEIRIVEHSLVERDTFVHEIIRIALYRACGIKLANMTDGGDGASGYNHTSEARKKMSCVSCGKSKSPEHCAAIAAGKRKHPTKFWLGKNQTAEHRKKNSDANRGKKRSLETRRKQSEAQRGRSRTPETCRKIANTLRGRKLSYDHIQANVYGHRGKVLSDFHCTAISNSLRGKPKSLEHRKNLSVSHLGKKKQSLETIVKRVAARRKTMQLRKEIFK